MGRGFIFVSVLVLSMGMVAVLGTGCPPASNDLQKILIKALAKDGCRGCDSCEPDEGEGEPPEGETSSEGEVIVEGEGEIIEGEAIIEGEGEAPAEGEIVIEGEGEVSVEGEGEVQPEGEGELSAEGEVLVEGEGESIVEGEVIVEGEGEAIIEGEGEVPAEGEVPVEGEGEVSGGSIQLFLRPEGVQEDGPLWQIDDGVWRQGEMLVAGVSTGVHTVSFAEVAGWVVPEPAEVVVEAGQTATVMGLYSMTIPTAVERFQDEEVTALSSADNLYDAFVLNEKENGFDAASVQLDTAIEDFVAAGGDYAAFSARSAAIPPALFSDVEVLDRRLEKALKSVEAKASRASVVIALPGELRLPGDDEKSSYLDNLNCVVFVNGINTDHKGFTKGYRALVNAVEPFREDCGIVTCGIWNPTAGIFFDLLVECVVQKVVEAVEQWINVPVEHPTTSKIRQQLQQWVDDDVNVIVVPHSQGNFHVWGAVNDMDVEARASINVLQTASPAGYMPVGVRNNSRVDIEGDLVAQISGVADNPFPYEGAGGLGTWLSNLMDRIPIPPLQLAGDLIDLLNRHSFDSAYLKGQARAAILQRIQDYCVCSCEEGDSETFYLPGDVPLHMKCVPAGTFMMGRYPGEQDSYSSEDPQHEVTLTRNFYMGKYEVTKRQWQAVMGTTPWAGLDYVLYDPDSPAVYVSWNDVQAFITALNTHLSNTGQGCAVFRLPTEAEWEYACRAGTTTRFYWGNDPGYTAINSYAWWWGNTCDYDYETGECRINEWYAHVVGRKLPNAFGLYDMSGNVWEWCEDDWHSNYTGLPTDGRAWVNTPRGSYRVLRGGGWDYHWGRSGDGCRSAARYGNGRFPSSSYNLVGFRLSR